MMKLIPAALILVTLLVSGMVLADTEPNDNDSNANRLDDGDSVSGTCYSGDDDWYVVKLGGNDRVEVTVEADLGTDEYIFAYSWVDGDPDGSVDIDLDEFSSMEMESYTNNGLTSMDLHIIVNGDGAYTISIEISEGGFLCCGGAFVLLSISMIGIVSLIALIRRR